MLIDSNLSYIDTCVLQMFSDRKDPLRPRYDIRPNGVESSLHKRRGTLCIPMFALGEATYKVREKCRSRAPEVISEMYRLIDTGVLEIRHLDREIAQKAYGLAKQLVDIEGDERDYVSPMDALIVATAVSDPDCSKFYTTDKTLLVSAKISEIINGWCEDNGLPTICISDISDVIKHR